MSDRYGANCIHLPPSVVLTIRTWESGQQTVELSSGQGGPGQVQRDGLTFDNACQGLVTEWAAPTDIDLTPQTFVTTPTQQRGRVGSVLIQ